MNISPEGVTESARKRIRVLSDEAQDTPLLVKFEEVPAGEYASYKDAVKSAILLTRSVRLFIDTMESYGASPLPKPEPGTKENLFFTAAMLNLQQSLSLFSTRYAPKPPPTAASDPSIPHTFVHLDGEGNDVPM